MADPIAALALEIPDVVSPASLDPTGQNRDFRLLRIYCMKVTFQVMP